MPTRSLTVASEARIKPPKAGQLDYFDKGYPGLALRVSYGGAKAWVYFYRLHGKLRRLSLGRHPGMSLTEVRDAWRSARLAVSKGESPAHIRPTTADSFAAVAAEWLERDQAQNRSAKEVRRVIERDVLPVWGERLIAAITRRDALELIDGVADRGAITMARRLHSHLHRLFRWSVGRGILETNPMTDLPKPGSAVKRDRARRSVEGRRKDRMAVRARRPVADIDRRPARGDRRTILGRDPQQRDPYPRCAQQVWRDARYPAIAGRHEADRHAATCRRLRV
jgi:hypothetical protein